LAQAMFFWKKGGGNGPIYSDLRKCTRALTV
jgi:hypothetical protein